MRKGVLPVTLVILALLALAVPLVLVKPAIATGATTSINVIKYASDGTTILNQTTIDWTTMQSTLPVHGDGITHYYMEGPNFTGDMWDANETGNLKDRGAVMGTDLKDLCNLVGGMSPGDTMQVRSSDGWQLDGAFPYSNVYNPVGAQGPVVLCWWRDGQYVPAFAEGIRLAFMPRVTNAAGFYVFGDYDMQQCLPSSCWHYYYQGNPPVGYPSVEGLSGKYISEVDVYSTTGGVVGGGKNCFIATAAYGSYLDSHVDTLRSFRDQYLETNPLDSAFVSLYYKVSIYYRNNKKLNLQANL